MDKSLLQKAYAPDHFRELGHKLIDQLADHIHHTTAGLNSKTLVWNTPDKELQFWKKFLEEGNNKDFFPEILKRTTHTHNPKCIGHQVSAPAPITTLTAMLSALLNNGMAVYEMGMAPSAIEKVVINHLCNKIGYDINSSGLLTSGGTLANLTALLSARKATVDHDVWNEGYKEALGIMVCEQAHYCVDRAARIMGLGEKGIVKIPSKANFSMDVSLLEKHYEQATSQGIKIFAIVGSAPSTATGAYDDLQAIADFATAKNIWFHVDGAHGGAAIYSDKYRYLLRGIKKSDSIVIDGHKMMLMPTITTALLFKNKLHAQHTFSQKADYLLTDIEEDDWINSGKKTFECTKTMMSMHWYVMLKYYGEELFAEFVTRQYNLAQVFAQTLKDHPNFELATWPQSNILCFRVFLIDKTNEQLNELNATIRQELLKDGEFYVVKTTLNGILYLRTTLMNPFTNEAHLLSLLGKMHQISEA